MGTRTDSDTAVLEKQKASTTPEQPPKFQVVIHNDDYTPMDFVMSVLQDFFAKTLEEAEELTLRIHHEGKGVCGVYILDIAQLKVDKVMRAARQEGHPLQCTLSPATPSPSPSKGMKP